MNNFDFLINAAKELRTWNSNPENQDAFNQEKLDKDQIIQRTIESYEKMRKEMQNSPVAQKDLRQQFTELNDAYQRLQNKLDTLDGDNAILRKENREKKTSLNTKVQQLSELTINSRNLELQIARLKEASSQAEKDIEAIEARKKIEADLAEYEKTKENEAQKLRIESQEEDLKRVREENDQEQEKLNKLNEELIKLGVQIDPKVTNEVDEIPKSQTSPKKENEVGSTIPVPEPMYREGKEFTLGETRFLISPTSKQDCLCALHALGTKENGEYRSPITRQELVTRLQSALNGPKGNEILTKYKEYIPDKVDASGLALKESYYKLELVDPNYYLWASELQIFARAEILGSPPPVLEIVSEGMINSNPDRLKNLAPNVIVVFNQGNFHFSRCERIPKKENL